MARLELAGGDAKAAFDQAREAVGDYEFVVSKSKGLNSTEGLGSALETLGEVEWALGARASACGRFRRSVELLAPLPQEANVMFDLSRARAKAAACVTR